jgi:hypothetical protein
VTSPHISLWGAAVTELPKSHVGGRHGRIVAVLDIGIDRMTMELPAQYAMDVLGRLGVTSEALREFIGDYALARNGETWV